MKIDLDDGLLIAGCVCVVIGVALWSIPAAFVTAGVELIGFGFLVGRKMANDGAIEESADK